VVRLGELVEAGRAVLLVLVGAVADFPEPMDEDRPGQAVARFALVQFLAGFAAQLGFADPVEREQRALLNKRLRGLPAYRDKSNCCRADRRRDPSPIHGRRGPPLIRSISAFPT
jgi:hypothetical protein